MSPAKNKRETKQQVSSLGLDDIGDLSSLLTPPKDATGNVRPLELSIDLIDEDLNQARMKDNPGFLPKNLEELADTVRLRGIKSPISVRNSPNAKGRFIINHGARRLRASRLAGKKTIPAFIDNDYNDGDQVVENLQRNELTPIEIATYIKREISKGKKKGKIASELGKSAAFISQHVTLLKLPEVIAEVLNSSRSCDVTVINELVTAHKKKPDAVAEWLADENQEITRASVNLLREFLDDSQDKHAYEDGDSHPAAERDLEDLKDKKKKNEDDPNKLKNAIVQVNHDDRPARLILNRRPHADGYAWLKYEHDGQEVEAKLAQVQLAAILEG